MNNQNDFSKIDPIQDGVLVCTKKKGTIEQFKYIPLSQVKFKDGVSLGAFLEGMQAIMKNQAKEIEELKKVVGISVDYQLAQAAEGAANEEDSVY